MHENTNTAEGTEADGERRDSATSARERKTEIEPVDPQAVLAGVRSLEISRWAYESRGDVTHMGPMAGAFRETFEVGADPARIAAVDAHGVTLAAIQGLAERLEERDERIAAQRERIAALESRVATLEKRVSDGSSSAPGDEYRD